MRGLLLLGVLTILWGSNWPAMKLALRELDPWVFRTVCLLVGGAGLLTLVRAGGQSLRVPRAERWPLAVIAFFNITGWHLCSAYGLTLVQAGRAAIIAYTMPLWTVVFGWLLAGERIARARLAALGLGLLGMAVLVVPEASLLCAAPAGTLLILAAAVSWALRLAAGGGARSVSGLASVSTPALLGTAYAALVGVIFCHWAWFRLVAILPASVAAIGTLGIPIVGLFGSALLLGEPVGPAELVALVLVVGGLAILVRGFKRREPESLPEPRPVSTARRTSG
jgi:drug/metabolite transporter (DMT)-like permease